LSLRIQYNIISSSYFYLTKNYTLNTAPTEIEKIIFKGIQNFFQKLPPLASDDYKNGFDDIIAMYGFGGEDYIMVDEEYENIISAEIAERINKLSIVHKKELIHHYEKHPAVRDVRLCASRTIDLCPRKPSTNFNKT
jgi:hypothetical protein